MIFSKKPVTEPVQPDFARKIDENEAIPDEVWGAVASLGSDDERHFTFARKPLTPDQATDVQMIVNSEQYAGFRAFLQALAFEQYIEGRRHQDGRTHSYNQLGMLLENIVAQLDAYRVKPEEKPSDDPYEV